MRYFAYINNYYNRCDRENVVSVNINIFILIDNYKYMVLFLMKSVDCVQQIDSY